MIFMAMDVFDKLPLWTLDAFDKFRDDRYSFLYLCKNCARTFDSKIYVDACKFCGHNVVELRSIKKKKTFPLNRENRLYRYYCPLCEKNFITSEKLTVCSTCRIDYMHVYTWDSLRKRDRLYIKLSKALKLNLTSGRQANAQRDEIVKKINQIPEPVKTKRISMLSRFFGNKEELPSY